MIGWQSVFFDFDGVILDSVNVKTEAFHALYRPYGADIADRVREHHLANGGMSRFDKFRHYHQQFLGEELDEDGLDRLCREFSNLVVDRVVESPAIPGAMETLTALEEAGIPAYVVSGTPHDEMGLIIRRRGLSRFFVEVHGSPRKKTAIVREILDRTGYDPVRCLFIGDALSDWKAAHESDLHFLGIAPCNTSSIFPEGTPVASHVHLPDRQDV